MNDLYFQQGRIARSSTRFHRFRLAVRGMQIEVDAAQRNVLVIHLAEDDGHLPIQCDAMAKSWSALLVGINSL